MFDLIRPKYLLVQRDHVTRGMYVVSYHWSRWRARRKAARLERTYKRDLRRIAAHTAPQLCRMPAERYSWEVSTR